MITKKPIYALLLFLLASMSVGCEKTNDSIQPYPYNIDIVSCNTASGGMLQFKQILPGDQGIVTLIPETPMTSIAGQNERVLLQYYHTGNIDDTTRLINVLQMASIINDTARPLALDSINTFENDPIKVNTAWRTGEYLNLNLQIEYNNRPHRLGLFRDTTQHTPDTLHLHIRHDSNGDVAGYWKQAYASYRIPGVDSCRIMQIYANMPDTEDEYITLKIK